MYSSGLVRLYNFQAITEQVEKIGILHIIINLRFGPRYVFHEVLLEEGTCINFNSTILYKYRKTKQPLMEGWGDTQKGS